MIISKTKRAFEIKQKTFCLVSKGVSFGLTKQIGKNVAGTSFKSAWCAISYNLANNRKCSLKIET